MFPMAIFVPTGLLAGIAVWATSADPLTFLLNYGVLGIIVILAATGFISFKPHVSDLNKRIDAQAAIITEFQLATRTSTVAMTRTTDVLENLPHADGVSQANLEALVSRAVADALAGDDRTRKH